MTLFQIFNITECKYRKMPYHFFGLSPENFSEMIATKSLMFKDKPLNIADIIKILHIDASTGTFDTRDICNLNKAIRFYPEVSWENLSYERAFRKYCQIIFGKNEITKKSRKGLFKILLHNMNDKTLLLLFFASVISLIIGGYKIIEENDQYAWVEGVSILLAVIVIVILGTVNEYSQERLFNRFETQKKEHFTKIFCDSTIKTINSKDLTVSDIIYLEPGDLIPADCIIITENKIITDEILISGESEPVLKSQLGDFFVISGSYVIEGIAKALVIATGKHSVKAKIIQGMVIGEKKTPLEHKIEALAEDLSSKALIVAFILFICHLAKLLFIEKTFNLRIIMALVIESISIVIMAVPEGLPMAVALALSFATKQMMQDNNLVRDVSACETMNNTNYICTDKTGTLTYNDMSVEYLFANKKLYYVNERRITKDNDFCSKMGLPHLIDLTMKNIILNSSAFENSEGKFIGSNFEAALLRFLNAQNVSYKDVRREYKILGRLPFSSKHKYMSTMITYNGRYFVFFKGAPDLISRHCKNEEDEDQAKLENRKLIKFVKKCDRRCLRTMAFSYLEIEHYDPNAVHIGKYPCTFMCAVAVNDPLRENIREEILKSQSAGLNIVMLTGDRISMAEHLAIRLGILKPGTVMLSGHQFREKSDYELETIIERITVVARANQYDKKRFVELLQKKGNIVAVTGDGTNDGPALKIANVGFGMGISGTDIAKEASGVIIMDDKFSSIVKSIACGRCTNHSIRRFIQFQLTTTLTTIVIAMCNSIFSKPGKSSFNPLKLLWINIIMDTFAALALATDKPSKDVLKRMPESPLKPIITKYMKAFIITTSAYQFLIMFLLQIFGANSTFIYNVFIFLQLFNLVNARSLGPSESPLTGLLSNNLFLGTNLIVILLQILILSKMQFIFKTQELSNMEWIISIAIASTIMVFFYFFRYVIRAGYKKLYQEDSITEIIIPQIPLSHAYNDSEILSLEL